MYVPKVLNMITIFSTSEYGTTGGEQQFVWKNPAIAGAQAIDFIMLLFNDNSYTACWQIK